MATYQYIAKTAQGESVKGTMQGESESSVLRTLAERSLFPVQVAELDQASAAGSLVARRVRQREIGQAFGQMADLLRAGVPILRTLETLAKAASNPALRETLQSVCDEVSNGRTLADSLGDHPRQFTKLHTSMIHAGEEAGFLEDVLENLAAFIERQDELRSKVRSMLMYPVVLLVLGLGLLVGIMVLVVPKFKGFFESMTLPGPTRILFAVSDLLTQRIGLLVAILVLLVMGAVALFRSEFGRSMWQRLRLSMPVLGAVNRSVAITRFCRILGTMLHNGVPILQALEISKDATGSEILAGQIAEAAENVRAGEPLAEPFRHTRFFPPDVLEMIAIAEESNQMDRVLLQVADTIETRTNRKVDAAVRLIEPLILVVLAVTIGFVAVGLLYPIFLMSQTLTA
jgi:general secretion pathway protein F